MPFSLVIKTWSVINPDPEGQELINDKLLMTEDLGHVFVVYALWLWFIVYIAILQLIVIVEEE